MIKKTSMKKMICDCGWKHSQGICPQCGNKAERPDEGVRQWNSTLSVKKPLTSRSRPNPISKKRKKRGSSQADAMKKVATQSVPECSHCGMRIVYWKYSNIDHIDPKGKHPELIDDIDNMQVLCDEVDVMQQSHKKSHFSEKQIKLLAKGSCHHLKHHGSKIVYNQKKDMFR